MRGPRGPWFNCSGSFVFLLAFAIMGYTGWSTLRTVGPMVERLLSKPTPTRVALASPTATPPAPTATSRPSPAPSPTATPAPRYWRVANTGGAGVWLRRTPRMGDRLRVWPDDTHLEEIEADVQGEGRRWLKVRDPAGNEGFVPAEYLAPVDH